MIGFALAQARRMARHAEDYTLEEMLRAWGNIHTSRSMLAPDTLDRLTTAIDRKAAALYRAEEVPC